MSDQRIEVLFERAAGTYRPGQVAVFLESDPFLTAVLKGKFATVVNPPTWELDAPKSKEEIIKQSAVVKSVFQRDTKKKQELAKQEETAEVSNQEDENDSVNINELDRESRSL